MNSRLVLLPYKLGSGGARGLAQSLSERLGAYVRRISGEGSYRPRDRSLVVCWGRAAPAGWTRGRYLNRNPEIARNKLATFRAFRLGGVPTVNWTTSREEAQSWVNHGSVVVSRLSLTGSGGSGIRIVEPGGSVPTAPLHTLYTPKRREFRAHVFNGRVIDTSEKRKRTDGTTENSYIRNSYHGWVFCHDGVTPPTGLAEVAVLAVQAAQLNFGAVDLIETMDGKCLALEVNSAPGIEGTTLTKYTEAIANYL